MQVIHTGVKNKFKQAKKEEKKEEEMADVNKKFKLSTEACSVNMAKEPHLDPDWFQAISDMKVKGEHAEQHTQMI